jgi:hypothetical protein
MLVGGLNFTVLRGNGTDTFSYLAMAGYLQHEPFSWAQTASTQALIDKHSAYALAQQLFLLTRWATPIVLAWCSSLLHIPLYRFEYGFTVLFFMMLYGCTFVTALFLPIKSRYAALVATAVSVGFWAQLVLDIRAMSEISALPILLLSVLILSSIEKNKPDYLQQAWLGITIAALGLLYVEILPYFALGVLLFLSFKLLNRQESILNIVKKYGFASIIAVTLLFLTSGSYLIHLLTSQINMALHFKNNWDQAYFSWLYTNPVLGFWGLSGLDLNTRENHWWVFSLLKFLLFILGIFLSIIFLYTAYFITFTKKNSSTILNITLALLLATLIEFFYLFLGHQRWAAGKIISYSYPFILLFITAAGLNLLPQSNAAVILSRLGKYSVLLWLLIQCSLGFYRIGLASTGQEYPHYISHHGIYKKHDWDIKTIAQALKKNNAYSVELLIPDEWYAEYLALALGWDIHVINNLKSITVRTNNTLIKQTAIPIPRYVLVTRNYFCLRKSEILARNEEIVLVKTLQNALTSCLTKQ